MKTELVELVETHTILKAVKRMDNGKKNGYDPDRWKRGLYHALCASDCATNKELQAIRIGLDLP